MDLTLFDRLCLALAAEASGLLSLAALMAFGAAAFVLCALIGGGL